MFALASVLAHGCGSDGNGALTSPDEVQDRVIDRAAYVALADDCRIARISVGHDGGIHVTTVEGNTHKVELGNGETTLEALPQGPATCGPIPITVE